MKILMLGWNATSKYKSLLTNRQKIEVIKPNYLFGQEHDSIEDAVIYSKKVSHITKKLTFDIIQCSSWPEYLAGINIKKYSKKPLIINVSDTVFDRYKEISNEEYEIEKQGFESADKIVVSSNRTKNIIIKKYNISQEKIELIYFIDIAKRKKEISNKKTVLFVCRSYEHKDIEYFIKAAKEISRLEPITNFIIIGSKDVLHKIINNGIYLVKNNKLAFIDKKEKEEITVAFDRADIVVASSISDDFLANAVRFNTPIITSKAAAVSEVLKNSLKIDLSNTVEIVDKVVSLIRYDALGSEIRHNNKIESRGLSTREYAEKLLRVYNEVIKTW